MKDKIRLQNVHVKLVELLGEIEGSSPELKERLEAISEWDSFVKTLKVNKSELINLLMNWE